ncbi:PIN domain-containing protein [Endothiovibrio diazotrophicus]
MIVAVIDTTTLVSGLITANPYSPTALVVDDMVRGRFPFLLSPELLGEYRRVLLRPKLRKLHGLSEEEVDALLTEIVTQAVWREPRGGPPAPDPGDDHLWALLELHPGSVLVTGDRALLEQPPEGRSVLTPRGFLEAASVGATGVQDGARG